MAAAGLILERYRKIIRDLFPRGSAWASKDEKSSVLRKLLDSLGYEPCRIEDASKAFIDDVFPDTTSNLLTDWERLLALPDACEKEPENLTVQERRERIIQVLTTLGGQNVDFYKNLVNNFGIDIDVIDVEDQPPFRAGQGRAGDSLTNGNWRYAFVISAPVESATVFRAGPSRAGDPLRSFSNPTIQCLINKHKPAHTIALFRFAA